ncbi:winged helix-turn-helix domain-containing protein [Methylocystis parvus]|uniref:Winged helix-turn-helix domain-containing protein n=1 Tax=Methylocystis parvus TaxID=134 RepID=A0A6B8MAK9_9HYPH|nr:helix-turn-helix domain-containing protein [Methylocystis parvus]QGM98323.1 winged helix-turn-helix domain-containing protein [Methylocystis parvus]WBK01349.1 helix-turn-helix domain-containing protein [Methylocystis parvus OBBP]
MTRSLFVSAGPGLLASFAEPFEAFGGCHLRAVDGTAPPGPPWPQAALLDGAYCDAPALARRLRAAGFPGTVILIDAAAPEATASFDRPFRLADLLALIDAPPGAAEGGAPLTEKETAILARLAQAGGATLSKAALLADVWGYGPNVSTRTLETHIHRLRRKIEADPKRPLKLLTEDGGYRLANAAKENFSKPNSP